MSRIYDNWERLVGAVFDREELRELALCESFSTADIGSRFSVDEDDYFDGPRISIDPGASSSTSSLTYHSVRYIEFAEIKKATEEFDSNLIIGQGYFGVVYKGWIDEQRLTASKAGSGNAVAVKTLGERCLQGHDEWMNEINYLSQLHHPNLVRLIGFSKGFEDNGLLEESKILVYEFMSKGSLDNHLFTRGHQLRRVGGHQSLPWETRIKVAIGAARALSFLHEREIPIIHRDFKSSDILLDGDFNVKLSDFGLARDVPTGDMTYVSTQVRGTYIAPEYMNTGRLTVKCDVYAFGVVLLELISGQRVLDLSKVLVERNFAFWGRPYAGYKKKLLRFIDARLEGQYPSRAVNSFATLALQCLSDNPKQRPRMSKVLVALEQL